MNRWSLVLMILFPLSLYGQFNPRDNREEEAAQGRDEEDIVEWQFPLNLQITTIDELVLVPVITLELAQRIVKHRQKSGGFQSLLELQVIEGMDFEWLQYQANRYLYVPTQRTVSAKASSYVMNRIRYTKSLQEPKHMQGLPAQLYSRILVSDRRLRAGLTLEQDAYEPFRTQQLVDHKAGFVEVKNTSTRLVLGDYRLSLGQGNMFSSGAMFFGGLNLNAAYRSPNQLRPYASSGESGFLRGAALEMKTKGWQGVTAFSLKRRDGHWNEQLDRWVIKADGLHRDKKSLLGRQSMDERIVAMGIRRQFGSLNLGLQAVQYGMQHHAMEWRASIDFRLRHKRGMTFGEFGRIGKAKVYSLNHLVSLDAKTGLALSAQGSFGQDPALQEYRLSQLTDNRGKWQVSIERRWKKNSITIIYQKRKKMNFEASEYTSRNRILFQLAHQKKKWQIISRFSHDNSEEQKPSEFLAAKMVRWRGQFNYEINKDWEWSTRTVISHMITTEQSWGQLLYLQARYQPQWQGIVMSFRYTHYSDLTYANRVYVYEPSVRYAFSVPAFSGSGNSFNLLVKWPWRNWKGELHYRLNQKKEAGARFQHWLTFQVTVSLR